MLDWFAPRIPRVSGWNTLVDIVRVDDRSLRSLSLEDEPGFRAVYEQVRDAQLTITKSARDGVQGKGS